MNSLNLDVEWEDGVLYKIILVQQELPIFAEYDYSAQWELIEKTLVMDMNKEKLFSFVLPKNGKKVYMRKYAKCPANGNSELAVGTMEGPRDFARALIVLHSHMYKVPYIVLERYRHISNNPDVMAKMIERAFNWALRDTSVRVVLERWDTKGEYIDYHKDSRASWDIEFDKSNGKNLIKMGYEDALEVYKRKEAEKETMKGGRKSDDIMDYIVHSNKEAIVEFIRQAIKGFKSPKEIARPIRLLCEYKVFVEYTPDGEQYRLPYKAFINAFPEVKGLITMRRFNDWLNNMRTSYENSARHIKLKKEIEKLLSL